MPFINDEILLGGFYTPERLVSSTRSRPARCMRDEAVEAGALQVFANTEVLDLETDDRRRRHARSRAVVTDKGRIEAEYVVIACGVWSPRIATMAGANIPLTPAVHQMADVGPIDILAESEQARSRYPIVRDMDTFCYERQSAGSMEVGSLRPPTDLHAPRRHPVATRSRRSRRPSCRSPTTTSTRRWKQAIELMDMLGDAEIRTRSTVCSR